MSQAREIHKKPPAELWIVWAEGKYRIYWSAKQASNLFDRYVKKGSEVELIRYDFAGIQSKVGPKEVQDAG